MWIETRLRVCIDRWLTTGSAISLQCPPLDLKALFEDLPRICKAPAVECAAEGASKGLVSSSRYNLGLEMEVLHV